MSERGDLPSPSKSPERDREVSSGSERPIAQTQTGISLLALTAEEIAPEQRLLINWLARREQATCNEICTFMQQHALSPEQVQPLLDSLLKEGLLSQAILNGEVCYRVAFRGRTRRIGVGLPDEVWQRVDQDRLTFLRSLSLFSQLSDEQLRSIADQMEEVHYQRGDVLLWQGKSSDCVFFIKSGIVGITHYSLQTKTQKILNYVRQGEIIGEYSAISGDSGVASATASALTSVYALKLKRDAFLAILSQHASVAVELARVLAVRLVNSSVRASTKRAPLIVVIDVQAGISASSLGIALALTLAAESGQRVVYTEVPEAHRLAELFALDAETDTFAHDGGYDVVAQLGASMIPPPVRATLLLDQLFTRYANVIVGVPYYADETISYLAGYADQIVLVGTLTSESAARLAALRSAICRQVNVEKASIFSVLKYVASEPTACIDAATWDVDFVLPYYPTSAPYAALTPDELPEALRHFATTLIDRLGRTNAVSLYIPTTVDVNTAVDTMPYVERTLAFFGQLFGGATTTTLHARGVWSSAEVGLVSETIHIVRSYAAQADLDAHLQHILDYAEQLKCELRQEAMAVEVNQKLMLI
ncbi:MAG: cyclic nucleotide-binding domain-containing protein [Anaerolineae bacterium]|nr:cyclic nucleotide-binding domain-containing protein [Anaerolineae bacterium]MDW8299549.1 cyclic nucleotide-binding domain-containing protein [Anaerolineae bacterium]